MAISLVNKVQGSGSGATTTVSTSAFPATTGNLIFVLARGAANGATMAITDTAGNTYTQIGTTIDNTGLGDGSIWYAKNITGNASNVVKCTWTGGTPASRGIIALEYSGLDTVSPLDAHPTAVSTTGSAGSATSNSFSTTSANEVIIGAACYDNGSAASAGAIGGTTATLEEDIATTCAVEDLIVSSTQTSITAAISSNGSGDWIMFAASFKAAAATTTSTSTTTTTSTSTSTTTTSTSTSTSTTSSTSTTHTTTSTSSTTSTTTTSTSSSTTTTSTSSSTSSSTTTTSTSTSSTTSTSSSTTTTSTSTSSSTSSSTTTTSTSTSTTVTTSTSTSSSTSSSTSTTTTSTSSSTSSSSSTTTTLPGIILYEGNNNDFFPLEESNESTMRFDIEEIDQEPFDIF